MRRIILFSFFMIACGQVVFGQSFNWGIKAGNTGLDFGIAVKTDAQNNVYEMVYYNGSLTLDSAGTPKIISNYGSKDVAIIKYNCNKVFQWVIRVGGVGSDGGVYNTGGIDFDTTGNIYIHTTINGSANITSANGNNQVRSSLGQNDAVLIKASSAGIVSWVTQMGSSTGNDEGGGVVVDNNQNVLITGQFTGNANFSQTFGPSASRNSFGSADIYVAEYDPSGILIYATQGGGFLFDLGSGIDVDSTGAAYVVGNWSNNGNSFAFFGNNINNTGGWGAFIAKISATGAWVWGNAVGSANNEGFSKVVVDDLNDKVYVIGHYDGATTVNSRPPGASVNITTNGGYDAMAVCYNLNGSLQWARTFGGTGAEYGYGVDLDLLGNPVFTGEFGSSTNFGGTTLAPTGTNNAYVAKYSPANVLNNVQKIGTGSGATGNALHYSSAGFCYLTGYFKDSVIAGTDTLRSGGVEDAFLLRMSDNDTTLLVSTKTILSCFGDTAYLYLPYKPLGTITWLRNDTVFTTSIRGPIRVTNTGTYKAVSKSNCLPFDTSAAFVLSRAGTFSAPPVSDIFICTGDSGSFNASGAQTYSWTPATGLSNAAIANPVVKPTANTTYYLTMNLNGCIARDTALVSILTNCCLTCSSPYALNQGVLACYPFNGNAVDESGNGNNATVFNAVLAPDRFGVANKAYQFNGASSYLEVPNSTTLQSPTSKISFTFWARVTNWNINGGVQYNPIVSKSITTADAQYRGMIRSDGAYAMTNAKSFNGVLGTVTNINTWYFFTITVSNDTMYYYRNGLLLGFATGPTTYVLNNTTPLRIGRNDVNTNVFFNGRLDELRIYNRTLTLAEVNKLYALSNINGLPIISAGLDKNVCKGDSVQLTTAGPNGVYTPTSTFLWTPSVYLSSDTARSPYSKPDSTKSYIVKVDVGGCKNYDTVVVNAINFVPDIGSDRNICKGDTTQLIVQGGGNTFAWTPNYKITPTNNDTVKVYPLVDTSYIVVANNGVCSRRDTIRVSVIVPTINAGADKNICLHDTARFNVVSNGTVRWSPFKWLSDSVGANVYSVPDSNITYYATANYLGCMLTDTVSVNVAILPIDAGPNKTICKDDSVQLQATGATVFLWLPNYRISDTSIANPWVKPLIPTYYYCVSFNASCARYDSVFVNVLQAQANAGSDKSICNGDSVKLTSTILGPSWAWSPQTSLSDTSVQPYAKPAATTDYILTVTNGTCKAMDTVKVSVTNFNISAGTDQIVCKGDSVQLIATGGVKYNWLPVYNISDTGIANPWVSPLGPTNYFLLSNNGICLRVDTVFVDVKSFSATAGTDTSMCYGFFVGLQASGAKTYEWLNASTLSDAYIANPIASPASDINYYVKMTDSSSCTLYDTVFVKVNSVPVVDAGPDFKHCPGEFVTLNGSITGTYTRFEWSPAAGLSDKLILNPTASVTSKTGYNLNVWNEYCFSSDVATVDVNPQIIAKFTATPASGLAPLPVVFTNSSVNGYFYNWDFGEPGGTSTDFEPTYIFLEDGIFTVQLIVTDSMGCADTTETNINVTTKETIYVPTAFTPNGDGLNDLFAVVYSPNRFEFVELTIINRWGVKVFETKMPGGQWWDGKINGSPEPPGVFTYNVFAKDKKGKSYELNGTVAIVR